MAEIQAKGGKPTPRVDLTPMVDLNLLLITFFMFATTLSKPKAMEINMPFKDEKVESTSEVKESATLTLLLGPDHKVYYYKGIGSAENPPQIKLTYFKDKDGLRDVVINHLNEVRQDKSRGVLNATDDATIIIKPDVTCTTDDVIDALDEMTINAVPIYTIVDITDVDQGFIKDAEATMGN